MLTGSAFSINVMMLSILCIIVMPFKNAAELLDNFVSKSRENLETLRQEKS